RRREIQLAYNEEHGIVPRTVTKSRDEIMRGTIIAEEKAEYTVGPSSTRFEDPNRPIVDPVAKFLSPDQRRDLIENQRKEMLEASDAMDFERAAELRDSI